MREGVAAVALAAAFLLAGCGGYLGGPETTDAGAVTPAPVPSPEPDLPPGIHPNGVNASAVADAHESVLRDSAYELHAILEYRLPDGDERRTDTVGHFRPDGEAVGFERNFSASEGANRLTGYALWYDGERTVYRETRVDGSTDAIVVRDRNVVDVPVRNLTGRAFRAVEGHAVERTGPNGTVVSASVDSTAAIPTPPPAERARNVTMVARVQPSGVVDSLRLRYDVTVDGESVPVRFETRIENVSDAAPDPPEWVQSFTEADERR